MPFRLVTAVAAAAASVYVRGATIFKTGTRQGSSTVQVAGVGSAAGPGFNPAQFSSWHFDERYPLIHAKPGGRCPDSAGNIYNANIVANGETDWNVFFGGWDGVNLCHDSVSLSVTSDSFITMNAHVPVIATGTTHNLNNPSVIKTTDGRWFMVYTQEEPQLGPDGATSMINKPGISWSADGLAFSPSAGGQTFISMGGYPFNWTQADVNGGNVLLEVNGTLHLYFVDFKSRKHSVYHATAPMPGRAELPPTTFTYLGIALSAPGHIVNDLAFVNGHYLMGLHCNGPEVFYSTSRDPVVFPPATTLFQHRDDADAHIVSLGFVVDNSATRVLGALYGAGASPMLNHNQIFAAWLQRHVLFVGTDSPPTVWGIGGSERAVGPNTISMPTSAPSLEGRFMVYETDYRNASARGTLLYTSAVVLVTPGDTWVFQP